MEQSEKGVNREKTGRTGDKKGWNREKKKDGTEKKGWIRENKGGIRRRKKV